MPKKTLYPRGTLHSLYLDSPSVSNNLLGDPSERRVDIYIPQGHDGSGLPLLVDLVGFTAGGPKHTAWLNFGENVPERADRLIAEGEMPPCVIAFPDCFSRLGGNQYVNSSAMGNWADFITQECVPEIEKRFGCGGDGHRGVFGKSSGGYGAMVHALLYPHIWSAAASHSGDMGFELMFAADFAHTLRRLDKYRGSIKDFIEGFEASRKVSGDDLHALMILAMAATYDPDPQSYLGIRLPVTLDTCERIPERWANWMRWDPIEMLKTHADNLRSIKALYIDCGTVDQYNLLYGARRMSRDLTAHGIAHTYEEFPDNHSSTDYRMDISLPILAKALS